MTIIVLTAQIRRGELPSISHGHTRWSCPREIPWMSRVMGWQGANIPAGIACWFRPETAIRQSSGDDPESGMLRVCDTAVIWNVTSVSYSIFNGAAQHNIDTTASPYTQSRTKVASPYLRCGYIAPPTVIHRRIIGLSSKITSYTRHPINLHCNIWLRSFLLVHPASAGCSIPDPSHTSLYRLPARDPGGPLGARMSRRMMQPQPLAFVHV